MEIIEATQKIERLRIKNFAGISDAEMEFKRLNILIGPQASGKSICAKLVFFFREIVRRLPEAVLEERGTQQIKVGHKEKFLKYFPHTAWGRGQFEIEYVNGEFSVLVRRKSIESATLEIKYSSQFDLLLKSGQHKVARAKSSWENDYPDKSSVYVYRAFMEGFFTDFFQKVSPVLANDNIFIPAGRSFFSAIQNNIFSLMAANVQIDPFLAEFGSLYEHARNNSQGPISGYREHEKTIADIIRGKYVQVKNEDYIEMSDNRLIPLASSSSGQQEALPLLMVIAAAGIMPNAKDTFFVEEPEAHLFPDAQRKVIHFLTSSVYLDSYDFTGQCFITTHSPYILTSVNNLMYAGKIMRDFPSQTEQVIKVIGDSDVIDPTLVSAYLVSDGTVRSIIDEKSSLILASAIDEVSGELAKEFDKLLDIEFAEMAA